MEPEYEDQDVEYEDQDYAYDDDVPMDEELEELLKPEPMSFPDAYAAAGAKPVSLEVPVREYAYEALSKTEERRFPAKQVAKSASSLAQALKARAK
jgi:hypothetical protein